MSASKPGLDLVAGNVREEYCNGQTCKMGYNENDYNTHSFRIGAATHAAKMGKSDDEIMTMGRWKSDSYKRYIRIDTII